MDEKMDHGPIVAYEKWEMGNGSMTAPELASELARRGARLLRDTLPDWVAGRIQPEAQDETRATYSKMLRKEDGHVDWQKSAAEIERMVRAYTPWPGTYTFWQRNGKTLRLQIEVADAGDDIVTGLTPGRVTLTPGELRVGTGAGVLRILRLKREGGTSLASEEFLRGHPDIDGAHFD